MISRVPLLFSLLPLAFSCSPVPSGSPLHEEGRLLVVSDSPGPLAADQPIPVLTPPQLLPVWVPSHVDRERDLLVGEHWIFFKLTESEWFTDRRMEESVPAAKGDANPADLQRLRAVTGFDQAVVPYRESK